MHPAERPIARIPWRLWHICAKAATGSVSFPIGKRASQRYSRDRYRSYGGRRHSRTQEKEANVAQTTSFTALGKNQTTFSQLDVFPRPENVVEVVLAGEELTAFCPITHQPDFYSYEVRYRPVTTCIESKTFKLMIASYREQAAFAETLASDIAQQVHDATGADTDVTLTQQVRGGVSITAKASIPRPDIKP
jgi:7-cyano-7-deazaguanine reductase